MLGLVLVALLQTTTPEAAAPAAGATPTSEQAAAAAQTAATQTTENRRRCRIRNVTGTRTQSLVTCRTREGYQSQDTRDALHDLQRPAPTGGGPGG